MTTDNTADYPFTWCFKHQSLVSTASLMKTTVRLHLVHARQLVHTGKLVYARHLISLNLVSFNPYYFILCNEAGKIQYVQLILI